VRSAASLLCLVLLAATAAAPRAQAGEVTSRYQKLLEQPEQDRVQLASELAAAPGARATALLRSELESARGKPLRLALLAGLGRHARPELAAAVADQLRPGEPDPEIAAAAGKALAAMGDAGVAPLAAAIGRFATGRSNHRARPAVHGALADALGSMATPVALAAAATLARKGAPGDRRRILATLAKAGPAHGVDEARRDALSAADAPLILEGLRQLVAHEPGERIAHLRAIAARATGPLAEPLLAGLAPLVAADPVPELHEVLFAAAAATDPTLTRALSPHAKRLRTDAALGAFALARAPRAVALAERALLARLVGAVPGEAATTLLAELSQAREPEVADPAIAALGTRRDPAAVPGLRKLLASPGDDRRRLALVALHGIQRDEVVWRQELRAALSDDALRLVALDLLAELGDRETLAAAHALFAAADWRVRSAAYDFCRRVRAAETVPLLLDRLPLEEDRMRADVLGVLAELAGHEFPTEAQWRAWWEDHAAGFTLPPPQPARARDRVRPEAGSTRTYYSLPVVSSRVLLVVDCSGSMAAKMGTGGSTRLEEAKRQMLRVLDSTPPGHRLGVIAFASAVQQLQTGLPELDPAVRAALRAKVQALAIGGATNVHDALRAAVLEPLVDTIYLLTDGAPSAGPIRDPTDLRAAVAEWNRTRRIRIHTIALGTDSAMLRGIAADAGGKYVSVR
jgi:Mg-chelatase subunit ChlD